jgi:hypothetical protein
MTYIDVEMSMLAGDNLHTGHDVIKELGVDLLHKGVGGVLRQGDVQ